LVVPLAVREEPVGALVLADVRGQAYGQREVEVAAAVAGQAMVAYDNARLFTQVHELAVTDSLTGAGTRRSFMDVARREVALARRGNRSLAAVMVDIDHFKRINDAYGHQVGDDVIQEVAARLRADHRGTDLLARYGGEEFVLLLPDVNAGAAKIAEALRAAVAAAPVQTRSGPVPVTVSVGVAHLRESDADLDALLGRADACLYRAKQGGRDSVVVDTDPT
jgi:diguanylate cyclase (GGDEF)-like protein